MKKKSPAFFVALVALFTLLFINNALGQCSSLIITSSSANPASCPAGGSITVAASGTNVTYQITSGPAGYPTASNSTGFFPSLVAGTYVVQAKDACNVTASVTKTVANTYPAFSVSSAGTSNVCTGGTQGGTISATITGGKPPYQYDIVPVAGTPVYGSNTGSTSYSENVPTFGTYRMYAKDVCGEVRTYDIDLLPSQPKPADFWWEELISNRPCGETMDGLPTVTLNVHLVDAERLAIDFNNLVGSTWQMYKPSPANSITGSSANSSCIVSQGALLASGTITAANIPAGDVYSYPVTMPQEDIIFILTTRCGETFKYCYNFNEGNPYTPDAIYDLIQQACNASWNNQDARIKPRYVFNMTEPITYLLTKNTGTTQTNTNGYFYNLKMNELPATVKLTDACGKTVTKAITKPVQGSPLQSEQEPQWQFYCTNIRNTASANIRITGGDLPGLESATNVVITGGTVTAVPGISTFQDWIPGYIASNLLAGYTYKIVITNLCNEKDSIQFTVPANQWGQPVLNWNLTAAANALCGQNSGTITANSHFSGNEAVNYYLYNTAAPNTVVATNTTGIFQNVTVGNYKVKFVVPSSSTDCPSKVITDSVNVSLLGTGAGQSIIRKTITTCEAANGSQLSTGKAIVEVNGSAPFTYEIIKSSLIGTGATEVWTVSSVNNPSNVYQWDLPLGGDTWNTVYTYRSVDNCGNKVTTMGGLQPLGQPVLETTTNPCVGQMNYTLTLTPYAGNFTYSWVKLPDTVTVLGTQNSLTFSGPYAAAYNGIYRCYVSLNGCLNRVRDISISSGSCGSVLPVTLVSFNGSVNNNDVTLKWEVQNEFNLKSYDIERSVNGVDFTLIHSQPGINTARGIYSYNDNGITIPVIYYRLKIMDKDGNFRYSNVLKLSPGKKGQGLEIYPNPATSNISISFYSQTACTGTVKIVNSEGTEVAKMNIQVGRGVNNFTAGNINKLQPGYYIVEAVFNGKTERSKFIKL